MRTREQMGLEVSGHVKIVDDLGNVLVDKDNAVHPQNIARVFARGLANENNYFAHRIAFGNGGTLTDAAFTITYRTPNDGQPPDVRTWDSRLYHETYSEIVDEGNGVLNPNLGKDPGSAGPDTGIRPGGGAVPSNDPPSVPHVSGPGVRSVEQGLTSDVIITCVLNANEPSGQYLTDMQGPYENTETSFTFDEIGLYTTGSPAIDTSGSHDVDVGNKTSSDDTGLLAGTVYGFKVSIDGSAFRGIYFSTPPTGGSGVGGEILYGDLCEAINMGQFAWNDSWTQSPLFQSRVYITDDTGNFPSITGQQTYGFLRFLSGMVGEDSSIIVEDLVPPAQVEPDNGLLSGATALPLFASLNQPTGGILRTPVQGIEAGVQNNPVEPEKERERLLTHLIFSPVLKAANRTLTITYTLTISVARTQEYDECNP